MPAVRFGIRRQPEALLPVRREQRPSTVRRDGAGRRVPEVGAVDAVVARYIGAVVGETPYRGAIGSRVRLNGDDLVIPGAPRRRVEGAVVVAVKRRQNRDQPVGMRVVPGG